MTLKKKIFITGASSELITKLIALINIEEYEIYCLSRNISKKPNNHINWVQGDLLEINQIKEYLESCYMLIHAAAITHSYDMQNYFDINLKATKNLVDIALKYKVDKIVFISSRTAGLKSGAYGKSKLLAEQYIQKKFSNWLIFRPSEIFGGNKNEGIQKLINDVHTKKYIFCPINLSSKLYPVFINDTVKIIYDITFNKKKLNEIITVNGKTGFSYIELVKLVRKVLKRKIIIIPFPKFLMLLISVIIEKFHVRIGIVPDQIPRLFSIKENSKLEYDLLNIEDYLKNT